MRNPAMRNIARRVAMILLDWIAITTMMAVSLWSIGAFDPAAF
jgi:hypothetical protein